MKIYNYEAKEKIIDAAIANGSIDRLNMLLSAAHLLNCEANNLVEEASDLMAEKLPFCLEI